MTPMEIQYGKTRVIFFRLAKRSAPPFAASVTIDVFGERFGAAYTEGDNREVVATDTMKNFVYATAADFEGGSPDEYVLFLGQRLLRTYPQMERIRVTAHEVPLDPAHHITPMGRTGYSPPPAGPRDESDVVFRLTRSDVAMSEADFERRAVGAGGGGRPLARDGREIEEDGGGRGRAAHGRAAAGFR